LNNCGLYWTEAEDAGQGRSDQHFDKYEKQERGDGWLSCSSGTFSRLFSRARSCKFGKSDLIDDRGRRLFELTSIAC
jgi:hypothetical protein